MVPRLRFRRIRSRFCYLLELAVPPPRPRPDKLETPKPHCLRTFHDHFNIHSQILLAIRIQDRVMLV
jgi:hypothetical protein